MHEENKRGWDLSDSLLLLIAVCHLWSIAHTLDKIADMAEMDKAEITTQELKETPEMKETPE